jgi:hypothetical protein
MVGGPGDIMDTLPSARGFTLSVLERGTGKYDVVYRASEENGYGFIIYNAGDKKLILKGRLGSDHKETIYAGSKELQDIRKNKYKSQDDIEFLRRTCLSGRSWLVNLQNNNYYFVAIWNTAITQSQYDALKEYLTKFPSSTTYIQMGMAGTGPSSEFQLVSGFNPKISSEKPKLSKKEKEFVKTAHMRSSELPAGYAKALQKLRNMTESNDVAMKNYQSYQAYKNYALKLISKLEKIKLLGKAKTSSKDIVTQSSVDSVLIGLGKQFPELTTRLKDLYKYSFHYSDLAKLHQKGKLELNSWEDQSLSENAEMSQSDITKIIDYSEKLQSMFDVNDNLEDWVKAKLNHACDYVATVRDYLKFYHDEKEAGTTDDQIDEKWTNTYKKSINCSNPKGFSQKAHCKARRLRQAGKHTRSKPVREIYEAVVRHMLKEFNSSMAMGALKQLNSDAKELEQMLQPNTELEDWVKAKLNLAGEYLDDVYHHLDHFGPQGRKFNEVKVANDIEEGWKDWVAAGAIGLGAMSGKVDASKIKPASKPAITQTIQSPSQSKPYTVEDVIAATIVDEAGGEKNAYEGMQAVLNVIMNRVNGDVRKASMQCLKPYQFSGWNKINKKDINDIKKYIDSKKSHSRFKIALDLVNKAKDGSLKDITSGANHFLNVTTQQRSGGKLPTWYNKDKVVADIGRHQFLKLESLRSFGEYFGFNN